MRSISLNASELADLASEIVRRGGTLRFSPKGSSMAPAIVPGDRIVVGPPSSIRVGDLVMLRGRRPVVHRVIRFDEASGSITTKGDAILTCDPPAALDDVIGKITKVERSYFARLKWSLVRLVSRVAI